MAYVYQVVGLIIVYYEAKSCNIKKIITLLFKIILKYYLVQRAKLSVHNVICICQCKF